MLETSIEYAENFRLDEIVTPIDYQVLHQLLQESGYDKDKTEYLVNGFREGFSIEYQGPTNRRDTSPNHRLRCGSKLILWNKLMKEVKLKRVSGPWKEIPYKTNYIQSPITLVPKGPEGKDTRLVFNLSYEFELGSVNQGTPKQRCSVKYEDLDAALKMILDLDRGERVIYFGKLDASSAFRRLPLRREDSRWLVMKAQNPADGQTYYFADRTLCFGHSISCRIYQEFSIAVGHLQKYRTGQKANCYLDDVLVAAVIKETCRLLMVEYQKLCQTIGLPLSPEKIEGPVPIIIFLGALLNGVDRTVGIPDDKIAKGMGELMYVLESKKVTVHHMQKLTGLLNFFCRAVVPGRAFTRRMYSKFSGSALKQYHHIRVDKELRKDCQVWKEFLTDREGRYSRPFTDFSIELNAVELNYYTDASFKACGGYFDGRYFFQPWEEGMIARTEADINLLELYVVVASVHLWGKFLKGTRVVIFSDNMATVQMVNSAASKCPRCMHLIRQLTRVSLKWSMRIFLRHVIGKKNTLADFLSRLKIKEFKALVPRGKLIEPGESIPRILWPIPDNWWV